MEDTVRARVASIARLARHLADGAQTAATMAEGQAGERSPTDAKAIPRLRHLSEEAVDLAERLESLSRLI